MDNWISFWTILFFLSIVLFAAMAIVVSLGAVADIRALLSNMREQHRDRRS